jgi:hypothetical protein
MTLTLAGDWNHLKSIGRDNTYRGTTFLETTAEDLGKLPMSSLGF